MTPYLTTIAQNFCIQLMNMQAAIATRPEGEQYPTTQEVTAQLRLMSAIEKANKQIALLKKEAEAAETPAVMATPQPPAAAASIPAENGNPLPEGKPEITWNDFVQYEHLLTHNIDFAQAPVNFHGVAVERWWLIFNLVRFATGIKHYMVYEDCKWPSSDTRTIQIMVDEYLEKKAA